MATIFRTHRLDCVDKAGDFIATNVENMSVDMEIVMANNITHSASKQFHDFKFIPHLNIRVNSDRGSFEILARVIR